MRTRREAVLAKRPIGPRAESGSAAVEFALVLPLVLIVVLGLVQVGLVVRDRLLIETAARAGARSAALQDDDTEARAAALAAAPGLDPTLVTVDIARIGTRGDPVTVEITYVDPLRVPLVGWLVGSGVIMRTSAADRQEFG
jgi:Flp pilus assembly protein TadG